MAPRQRSKSRQGWPANLYPNRDGFKYRHPVTKKETWMGTDQARAFAAAKKLNALLIPTDDLVARVITPGETVADAIVVFRRDDVPGRKWASKTAEVYESVIRRIEAGLGSKAVADVTVKVCATFIREVTESDRARQQFRLVLGWILACAVEEGWIDTNPALATRRFQHERKRVRLTLDVYRAIWDQAAPWLRNAMDNLVSNAVKYSPLGKNIWVTAERRGPLVRFAVRDEGPGLTEDDKERLFGKFQRLSALPTNNESSTGLGLSIVKQIVEMHHGKVWAESEEGQGSTFIIELTCAEPTSPDEVLPPARRESRDRIPPPHGRRTDSGLPAERD